MSVSKLKLIFTNHEFFLPTVKLCSDMGLKEASDYAQELKKAERAREMKDQRATSSRPGSRRSSSRTSINSRTGSAVCTEALLPALVRNQTYISF